MTSDGIEQSDHPTERMTELTVEMAKPLEAPENADIKAIIFCHNEDRAGMQIFGYDDTMDAVADLFTYMQTLFKAQGKDLQFVGIPDSPEGLT